MTKLPLKFTAILQAEDIRVDFMDSVRALQSKFVENINLSDYGAALQQITCCFVLVPDSNAYENRDKYFPAAKELFLQIILDYEEVIALDRTMHLSYLKVALQNRLLNQQAFLSEAFDWEKLLADCFSEG